MYTVTDRCKICGKEFKIQYSSPYSATFMTKKLVEKLLDHVRREHSNAKDYIKELEEEIAHLDEILAEEMEF